MHAESILFLSNNTCTSMYKPDPLIHLWAYEKDGHTAVGDLELGYCKRWIFFGPSSVHQFRSTFFSFLALQALTPIISSICLTVKIFSDLICCVIQYVFFNGCGPRSSSWDKLWRNGVKEEGANHFFHLWTEGFGQIPILERFFFLGVRPQIYQTQLEEQCPKRD